MKKIVVGKGKIDYSDGEVYLVGSVEKMTHNFGMATETFVGNSDALNHAVAGMKKREATLVLMIEDSRK